MSAHEDVAGIDGIAQDDVQRQRGDGVQDCHDRNRQERRVRAVATAGLRILAAIG